MSIIEISALFAIGIAVLTFLGLVVKNAVSIAATQAKASVAHDTALKGLENFNDYRVKAAAEFATHAHLRAVEDRLTAAINGFGTALNRHTERLDLMLQSLAEKHKDH